MRLYKFLLLAICAASLVCSCRSATVDIDADGRVDQSVGVTTKTLWIKVRMTTVGKRADTLIISRVHPSVIPDTIPSLGRTK